MTVQGSNGDVRGQAVVGVSRAGLFSRSLALLGAIAGAAAGAAGIAASSGSSGTAPSPARDREIFGLALLVAQLQAALYASALKNGHLKGEAHQYAEVVGGHEHEHVRYLTAALGKAATKSPKFHFGDAVTDQSKFIATAVSIESTSLAVYNGQAVNLTPQGLAAAARVVSVEARHAAWARALASKDPAPTAVDTPITIKQAKSALRPYLA